MSRDHENEKMTDEAARAAQAKTQVEQANTRNVQAKTQTEQPPVSAASFLNTAFC